jgi:hypothetical protein
MDPLTDIDRAIREAMQVEPRADFNARIRARVAEAAPDTRPLLPALAFAVLACAIAAVVGSGVWRQGVPVATEAPVLASRDLVVLPAPPAVWPSRPADRRLNGRRETAVARDVVISRSEMLALQHLFSGITVAPSEPPPPADELSISELAIEPIAPFPAGPEGVRQ